MVWCRLVVRCRFVLRSRFMLRLVLVLLVISPIIAKLVLEPLLRLIGKTSYSLNFSMNMQIIIMAFIAIMILL